MQELHQLGDKLDVLLKKYTALQAENKRLRAAIAQGEKNTATLNEKIAAMEHELQGVQVGQALSDGAGNENMRKQLDSVISEIDKILNTLND